MDQQKDPAESPGWPGNRFSGPDSASIKTSNVYVYQCVDSLQKDSLQFSAYVRKDSARLFLPDTALWLTSSRSASGAKYRQGNFIFWSKEGEARLKTASRSYRGCKSQPREKAWEAARLRGIDFRALGQEPGWYVEITEGDQIKYVGNYGEDTVYTPVPPPQKQMNRMIYHATTDEHTLIIDISEEPCTDSMSGHRFPKTVAVTVDGRTYLGCGRELNRNSN